MLVNPLDVSMVPYLILLPRIPLPPPLIRGLSRRHYPTTNSQVRQTNYLTI